MPSEFEKMMQSSTIFSSSGSGGSPVSRDKYNGVVEKLEQAIEKLKEQDDFIKQVTSQPAIPGIIVGLQEPIQEGMAPSADVIFNGSMVRLPYSLKELKVGDYVLVVVGAGIMTRIDPLPASGKVVIVKQLLADLKVEVSLGGESAILWNIKCLPLTDGARVVIDQTNTIVLDIIPAPPAPTVAPNVKRTTWEDVVIAADVRKEIEQAIIWPVKYKRIMTAYDQPESAGAVLHGPPGCGKTILAKVVATLLSERSGKPGFFSVKGPELMNPFVGETERLIRELFAAARKHKKDTGDRATLFVDEADACLGRRGRHLHSDISVPAFLVEMDGVDSQDNPYIILATNRPHDLDEAVIREGRCDSRFEIKRPEAPEVKQLFAIYLAKRVCAVGIEETANVAADFLSRGPLWGNRSGAMVATLVNKMTARAIERDIADGDTDNASGISLDDVREAILTHAQNHQL